MPTVDQVVTRRVEVVPGLCARCGKPFMGSVTKRYCSKGCQTAVSSAKYYKTKRRSAAARQKERVLQAVGAETHDARVLNGLTRPGPAGGQQPG